MIELVEKSVLINADVNMVYNYISNMENYGSWFPGVIKIVSGNDLEHGLVGKQYVETIQLPEGQSEHTLEVTTAQKNRKYVTTSTTLEALLPEMTLLVSGDDEFCHVTWHFSCKNSQLKKEDEFIVSLEQNLNERAEAGLLKLKSMMEEK